jgi:integrase
VDKAAQLLIDIQAELPEGQPYLLLPHRRYRYLMRLKAEGKLKYELGKCPDDNFGRSWQTIFRKAGIEVGTFHDLRSTCITEWLEQGLMPHEVKELAGHADINMTMNYYVGIRESLIDRARGASSAALGGDFSAHFVRVAENGKK